MSHPFVISIQKRREIKRNASADITIAELARLTKTEYKHVYYFVGAENLPHKKRKHKPRTVKVRQQLTEEEEGVFDVTKRNWII